MKFSLKVSIKNVHAYLFPTLAHRPLHFWSGFDYFGGPRPLGRMKRQ